MSESVIATILSAVVPSVTVESTLVLVLGLVLAVALGTTLVLTIGYSVVRYGQGRRRDTIRDDLRHGLLDRLYGTDDPNWRSFVAELSTRERTVLEGLLDEYLRELDGRDARELARLGEVLGIDERALTQLKTGGYYDRLRALTWLALMEQSPDVEVLERHCTGTPRERAAAARVLSESDHRAVASIGVELLLRDNDEAFSVFGIDTLYRVARVDPTPLFDRAEADHERWDPSLREQVLLTIRNLNTVVGPANLSWIVELLSSDEERTRVEAARALGAYGWRTPLREQIDVSAICRDPSSRVRASAYRMLGEWGDDDAIATLRRRITDEPDARARVTAVKELIRLGEEKPDDPPEAVKDAWEWATAHAAFDDHTAPIRATDHDHPGDST